MRRLRRTVLVCLASWLVLVFLSEHQDKTLALSMLPPTATASPPADTVRSTPTPAKSLPTSASSSVRAEHKKALPPVSACTPTWISIPSIKVNESVIPYGLNNAGELVPPRGQVVWYKPSPKPGAVGASVIAGHDEWDGPSTFWNLNEVPPGSPITLKCSNGQPLTFVVTSHKSELKNDAMYDATIWKSNNDYPEIVVITCDKKSPVVAQHHLSNLVVYAKLVS